MLTKKEITKILRTNEEKVKRYAVQRIGIFGSFVTSSQKTNSDIDILVEFKKDKKTFDNYIELKFFLQKLLGRKVDLVIKSALKPGIRSNIINQVEYA